MSPSAASVAAWQRLLRESRVPLKFSRMPVLAPSPGDGRFALVPDVADLVDRAFPTQAGDDVARNLARQDLAARLSDPTPVTTVGVDPEEFERTVGTYLQEYRRFLACGS